MTKHIGIVACSAEGAALCYRTICAEAGYAHPEISMHTPPFAEYVACLDRGDWEGVGELMLRSANKLAVAGADFLISPDNTIHQALPHIESRLPLPWLHIADVVLAEAKARGFRRIGVLGTKWTMAGSTYPATMPRPDAADREEVHRIIMEELVPGAVKPESRKILQRIIGRMQGCDAVVLGCTELPLILDDATSPLPTLDSARLLARAALRTAASPLPR
jgi:aspartate racemase